MRPQTLTDLVSANCQDASAADLLLVITRKRSKTSQIKFSYCIMLHLKTGKSPQETHPSIRVRVSTSLWHVLLRCWSHPSIFTDLRELSELSAYPTTNLSAKGEATKSPPELLQLLLHLYACSHPHIFFFLFLATSTVIKPPTTSPLHSS
jgi:hypothetical protein